MVFIRRIVLVLLLTLVKKLRKLVKVRKWPSPILRGHPLKKVTSPAKYSLSIKPFVSFSDLLLDIYAYK